MSGFVFGFYAILGGMVLALIIGLFNSKPTRKPIRPLPPIGWEYPEEGGYILRRIPSDQPPTTKTPDSPGVQHVKDILAVVSRPTRDHF